MNILSNRFLPLVGALGLTGCGASLSNHTYYPEWPDSNDLLAVDPCSVRREPEIVLRGSESDFQDAVAEKPGIFGWLYKEGVTTNAEVKKKALEAVQDGLQSLRTVNPVFLCGLERVEILGSREYDTKSKGSSAHYSADDRVLRIRLYNLHVPLVHEVGHHIHNLGYFAPTLREFLAQSWKWEGGKRIHRCEGSHCFIYPKAGESPEEDWARSFETVFLRPTDAVVKTNLNLEVVGRTVLQNKVRLIFDLLAGEKPVWGTVQVGAAQTLPSSSAQVLSGSTLSLIDQKKRSWTEYDLAEGRFAPSKYKPADAEQLFWILENQQWVQDASKIAFFATRIGDRVFLMGRRDNFAPTANRTSSSIFELAPGSDKGGFFAERHYLGKETLLSGLTNVNGQLGYFTYAEGRLVLKTRAPGQKESTELLNVKIPEKVVPMHVTALDNGRDLVALAYEEADNYWTVKLTTLRFNQKEGTILRGGTITMEREFTDNLRPPVPYGNSLIFPTYLEYGTTLGLLIYDLTKDRFSAPMFVTQSLPEEFKNAAGRLENLQLAVSGGKLYLIASVQNGPTLVAPIEVKF